MNVMSSMLERSRKARLLQSVQKAAGKEEALAMLYLVGYRWARATHNNPWIVGSILLLVGLVMVAIAMALGG
jgi:hypothetical protein